MSAPPKSRRAEYAEATRQAIIEAARQLFAEKGYFATTVEEVAQRARVAPATVYAVGGGKQGLLRTLVDVWSTAPMVAEILARQETLTDPGELLTHAAGGVRAMREQYGDIMRVVLAIAPHNPEVQEALDVATGRYRAALGTLAERLVTVGGVPADMTAAEALDILWFYFGYSGFFTLVDDNRWSYDQAQRWLVDQAATALRVESGR
jgi:AcrR family transcriptional regulator